MLGVEFGGVGGERWGVSVLPLTPYNSQNLPKILHALGLHKVTRAHSVQIKTHIWPKSSIRVAWLQIHGANHAVSASEENGFSATDDTDVPNSYVPEDT